MSKCVCKYLMSALKRFQDLCRTSWMTYPPISFKHIDVSALVGKMHQINADIDYLLKTIGMQINACETLREVSTKLDSCLTAVEGHAVQDVASLGSCLSATLGTQLIPAPITTGLSLAVMEKPSGT